MCKKLIWFAGIVLLLSTIPPVSQAQVVNLAPLNNSFEEQDDVFDWGSIHHTHASVDMRGLDFWRLFG